MIAVVGGGLRVKRSSFHARPLAMSVGALVVACGGLSASHLDPSGAGASDATGGTSNATGGTSNATGGTSNATGGTSNATGGTSNATGGTSNATGGTSNATGGTSNATGGTSNATGGTPATGGTSNGVGGTTDGVGGTSRGAGGTINATGGTGPLEGAGCAPNENRVLIPSATGWVDHLDPCNDVGVQGPWYAYGDQYGTASYDARCLVYGQHQPSECAQITTPDPNVPGFPNLNGEMRTAGIAEKVLSCVAGSMASLIPTPGCVGGGMGGGFDYGNMWGAGIGFDFNRNAGPPNGDDRKYAWDPTSYNVIGIQFMIVNAPPGMRVEFPMLLTAAEAAADTPPITDTPPTTDEHSAGAPYWGARGDGEFPNSPVQEGLNRITWDVVGIPKAGVYVFDTRRLLGIRFHMTTNTSSAHSYEFSIHDLTFLRYL
jgi:hypothetical protein